MTGLALYLAGGLLLVFCLLRLFIDGRTEDEFSNPLCGTEKPFVGVLSDIQLSAQVFGSEDWKYVSSFGSRAIEREFLRTRKALALAWVNAAKAEGTALMTAHRAAARTSAHLNFIAELRVMAAYISFLFFCMLLSFVIRVKGPVALQSLARLADSRSERLNEIVGQVFPLEGTFGQ